MGRASELRACAIKQNDVMLATCVGGNSIHLADGNLHIWQWIILHFSNVNFGMVDTCMDTHSPQEQLKTV